MNRRSFLRALVAGTAAAALGAEPRQIESPEAAIRRALGFPFPHRDTRFATAGIRMKAWRDQMTLYGNALVSRVDLTEIIALGDAVEAAGKRTRGES